MVKFDKVPLLLGLVLIVTLVGVPTKADGPVCGVGEPGQFNKLLFPKDFIWGTATAAFQVEGAVDEGCRGPSMWDTFIKKYPDKCQYHNADVAVDFYHRYKEDIKLMKDLNTNGFRFSISWSRIFPHGRMSKGVNKVGVEFYRSLIKELKANGITPLVTLFHWDTPQDLEDEYGGFLSSRIIQDFTEYANFIFNEFGDDVKHWITFNEPWVFSRAGYDVGKKAPGRCSSYIKKDCEDGRSGFEVYQVSHNLLLAHADAVQAFRTKCQKCAGGKIGIAHSPAWFEPEDLKAAGDSIDRVLDFILGWHLDPTTKGDYPQSMKDRIGHRLPKFTKAEKEKLKNSTDFVGMNYYTSFFAANIVPDPKSPSWTSDSRIEWESKRPDGYKIGSLPAGGKLDVYSKGLRNLLIHIKENYNNPEVIIAENGYGEELGEHHNDLDYGTKDYNRKYYLQKHLYSLNKAICDDKVNVTGYFVWSLLDNFEWQDGYNARFGLYFIDFQKNLTRHQKASGKWYSDFLKPQFPKLSTSSPNDEL